HERKEAQPDRPRARSHVRREETTRDDYLEIRPDGRRGRRRGHFSDHVPSLERIIMPRTTGGPTHARKRKRVLRRAKGFVGGPGTIYRAALEFTRKAGVYAYRHRRQRKRHF